MLAVYALMDAIANEIEFSWNRESVVVGTTPWVANDPTGDTIGLAKEIGNVSLMTSDLNFQESKFPELQAYEQGFVKEGVGAGGCAIGAYLHQNWSTREILEAVESCITQQKAIEDEYGADKPLEFAIAS